MKCHPGHLSAEEWQKVAAQCAAATRDACADGHYPELVARYQQFSAALYASARKKLGIE